MGEERHEFDEFLAGGEGVEEFACLLVAGAELGELLVGDGADVFGGEAAVA
jgi:hypothetical protein